jgi:hypothetical protein
MTLRKISTVLLAFMVLAVSSMIMGPRAEAQRSTSSSASALKGRALVGTPTSGQTWCLHSGGSYYEPCTPSGGGGSSLPTMTGNADKFLATDATNAVWRSIVAGASGGIQIAHTATEVSIDIVTAVVARLNAANVFAGRNTFAQAIGLTASAAPASPTDGDVWYDSTATKFKGRQNGSTLDLISAITLAATNVWTGRNTFAQAIGLTASAAPASPVNGDMWYDSTSNTFKGRENGSTVDMRSGAYNAGNSTYISTYTSPNTFSPAAAAIGTTAKVVRTVSLMTGSVSKCSINVTGASAGSTIDIAVFSIGTDGTTTTLLGQTEVSGASAVLVTGNLSSTVNLATGAPYYVGVVASDGTVTASSLASNTPTANLLSSGLSISSGTATGFSGGVWQSSAGTLTSNGAAGAIVHCHN